MLTLGLTIASALAQAASPTIQPIYGVARAVDGDSLAIGQTRVRLFGIDAPEHDQLCTRDGKRWACGSEAATQLSRLVTGRSVTCTPTGLDQYQRVLARCSASGTDVNRAMVQAGFALAYRRYSDDYIGAEANAKAAKRGIWSGTFEVPSEVRAQARPQASSNTNKSRPRSARVPAAWSTIRFAGGCTIKGNRSRRGEWIYHLPGMPYYTQTRPEEVFCSEAAAQAAGYRRAVVK